MRVDDYIETIIYNLLGGLLETAMGIRMKCVALSDV